MFEYCTRMIPAQVIDANMNELAVEGWEFMKSEPAGQGQFILFFKREKRRPLPSPRTAAIPPRIAAPKFTTAASEAAQEFIRQVKGKKPC